MTSKEWDELLERLAKIELYLGLLLRYRLNASISEVLTDPVHVKVYELTGNANRDEIVNKTGVAAGTVSGLWKKWEEKGIVIKDGVSYKKVF